MKFKVRYYHTKTENVDVKYILIEARDREKVCQVTIPWKDDPMEIAGHLEAALTTLFNLEKNWR